MSILTSQTDCELPGAGDLFILCIFKASQRVLAVRKCSVNAGRVRKVGKQFLSGGLHNLPGFPTEVMALIQANNIKRSDQNCILAY